jgi:hypothetical protein
MLGKDNELAREEQVIKGLVWVFNKKYKRDLISSYLLCFCMIKTQPLKWA